MIISDRYRFVFIHIPKNAGTSLRKVLNRFDDTGGKYAPHFEEVVGHGTLDFTHLPLHLLEKLFPEDLGKIRDYTSFAVIRDPYSRFLSSFSQWLKMYRRFELAQVPADALGDELNVVMRRLETGDGTLDREFIHFTRQADFIFLNGEQIVKNLRRVEDADLLLKSIATLTNTDLETLPAENPTRVFRGKWHSAVYRGGKNLADRVLPAAVKEPFRKTAREKLLRARRQEDFDALLSDDIRSFVRDYYSGDIALHAAVVAASGNAAVSGPAPAR